MKGENIKDNSSIKELIGYVGDRNDFFNSYKIKDIVKYYKLDYKSFDENKFKEINKIFEIPLEKNFLSFLKVMPLG